MNDIRFPPTDKLFSGANKDAEKPIPELRRVKFHQSEMCSWWLVVINFAYLKTFLIRQWLVLPSLHWPVQNFKFSVKANLRSDDTKDNFLVLIITFFPPLYFNRLKMDLWSLELITLTVTSL